MSNFDYIEKPMRVQMKCYAHGHLKCARRITKKYEKDFGRARGQEGFREFAMDMFERYVMTDHIFLARIIRNKLEKAIEETLQQAILKTHLEHAKN